jgi:hypothetical protein
MRVRQGWSGEIKPNVWAKVSVEVDETDLHRALAEVGIAVEPSDPRIPPADAFQLLDADCERLVLYTLMTRYGYPEQTGRARLAELAAARDAALTRIRAALEAG